MICPVCEVRFAPFPEEDFDYVEGRGLVPKTPEATIRREKIFNSDEHQICSPECDEATTIPYA